MATDITLPAQAGPALYYLDTGRPDPEVTRIDRVAVEDPRERALCRALLVHALELLDCSEPVQRVVMGLESGQ